MPPASWENGDKKVTKFVAMIVIILVTLEAATKLWFVEQTIMLSFSFKCDQIDICQRYDFGHTLAT